MILTHNNGQDIASSTYVGEKSRMTWRLSAWIEGPLKVADLECRLRRVDAIPCLHK